MERKQKIIRILVAIICIIVLTAVGYLIIFSVSDTLKSPPDIKTMSNLFIDRQKKDIEGLKNTTNIDNCKKIYDNILLSLKEDILNSFIDNEQFKSLDKERNFAYVEQFIILTNKYFEQSEWNRNQFIERINAEIKNNGFVERNTPIWNILQEFDNNIVCYNEMQKCIIDIYAISNNLKNYIPLDKILDKKNEKQRLLNRTCVKNKVLENELLNSYKKLEEQAMSNARLSVAPTDLKFDASGGRKTININSNVSPSSWTFSGVYRWLSISKNSSSFTIDCEKNPNSNERTDKFSIKISFDKFETSWEKDFGTINISQEGTIEKIKGDFEKVWVDHNVYQNGQNGMKIHTQFSVSGMLNKQGDCVAWFYYSDGTKLKDQNGRYTTSDSQVATSEVFKPSYENSTYNDFIIFMPYDELHLIRGKHNLKFKVGLFDQNKEQITTSEYVFFDINKP